MAKVEKLVPILFQWEGGWSDHQADKGGKTNMGITLATWQSCGYDKNGDGRIDEKDLKLVTRQDVIDLLKKHYWDRWNADRIVNQSIANLVVDWLWNSGSPGITRVQKIVGVKADGIAGPTTIASLNAANQRELFSLIKEDRMRFVDEIVARNPSQKVFLAGWKNRINSFAFSS